MGWPPGGDGVGRNGSPYPIPNSYPKGGFLLLFDPLDGSSNIDINISVGTIFRYSKRRTAIRRPKQDFLQPGTSRFAPATRCTAHQTMLVLTLGNGVNGFHAGSRNRQLLY